MLQSFSRENSILCKEPHETKRIWLLQAPEHLRDYFGPRYYHPLHQSRMPLYVVNSAISRCDEGFSYQRSKNHWFKSLAILVVTSGNVTVTEEGKVHEVSPGEAVILHPNRDIAWKTGTDGHFHSRAVELDGPCMDQILAATGLAHQVRIPLREPRRAIAMLKEINALSAVRGDGYLEALSGLAYDLLLELRACVAEISLPAEILQAVAFMRAHLESRITNAQIASASFKSVSRLSAIFKTHLGVPPMECFIRMKMEHARTLLTQTSESIARISDRLGLENQAYFSRLFRKHAGVTPSDFRRGPSMTRTPARKDAQPR